MKVAEPYISRLVDETIADVLADLPALMIVGPRACGKTTTALKVCAGRLRLDRREDALQARLDPEMAIRRPEPVLIDEWQLEPEVLAAVKRSVDDEFRPGRFVLTGSAQNDLSTSGWPATGRVVRIQMWGMTVRELNGGTSRQGFVDRVIEEGVDSVLDGSEGETVDRLIDRALQGSLPQIALGSERSISKDVECSVRRPVTDPRRNSTTGYRPCPPSSIPPGNRREHGRHTDPQNAVRLGRTRSGDSTEI